MTSYDDTSILISPKEYHFRDEDVVSDVLGFNVAFGVSGFNGSADFIEDPDIGTLKAYYRHWNFTEMEEDESRTTV